MALKNYALFPPSTVIQVDDRDPWVSWKNHLARTDNLRGGVDIVAAVGTPVYAPTDGVWIHFPNNGGAGNSGEFAHDDNKGWRDVFSHLSRYVGESGRHFNKGEIIAYSGNTGGVTQHLHRHLLDPNNRRRNPWDFFETLKPATGGKPINSSPAMTQDQIEEAELMSAKDDIINYIKGRLDTVDRRNDQIDRRISDFEGRVTPRFEDIIKVVTREGTDSRVYFNKASGVYAIGKLGYWWEFGQDINKEDIPTTWAARKKFGEDTLGLYRMVGLTQKDTRELEQEDWLAVKRLCLNFPANTSGVVLQEIKNLVVETSTSTKVNGISEKE